MKAEWRDITSYSQGNKERTPRSFQIIVNRLALVVTRHINYNADDWIVRATPDLLNTELLASKDLEDAKKEALDLLEREVMKLQASIDLIREKEKENDT